MKPGKEDGLVRYNSELGNHNYSRKKISKVNNSTTKLKTGQGKIDQIRNNY